MQRSPNARSRTSRARASVAGESSKNRNNEPQQTSSAHQPGIHGSNNSANLLSFHEHTNYSRGSKCHDSGREVSTNPIRNDGEAGSNLHNRRFLPPDFNFDHRDRSGNLVRPYHDDPREIEMHALEGSVGFRVWDTNSHGTNTANGFLAGRHTTHFRLAPDRNSSIWAEAMYTHLRPIREPSAWISIWHSSVSTPC